MNTKNTTVCCISQQPFIGPMADKLQPMVVDNEERLCDRLIKALEDAGYKKTPDQKRILCRWTGLTGESIRKWLLGINMPSHNHILIIAKKLGISAAWLIDGSGLKRPQIGIAEEPGQYDSLDWITERDIEMIKEFHTLSPDDQSRFEKTLHIFTQPPPEADESED